MTCALSSCWEITLVDHVSSCACCSPSCVSKPIYVEEILLFFLGNPIVLTSFSIKLQITLSYCSALIKYIEPPRKVISETQIRGVIL